MAKQPKRTTLSGSAMAVSGAKATMMTRFSFTAHFIAGAVFFARRAREIEESSAPDGATKGEHLSLVAGAVMQSCAALEAELDELLEHGPGHHLGSNGIDHEAVRCLAPSKIDRTKGVLERYDCLLDVLKKKPLDKGSYPYQDAKLLAGLRNELVHYRSRWKGAMTPKSLHAGLLAQRFAQPPFISPSANDFPHKLLSAACATWAAKTSTDFIDRVYESLGVPSVLEGHRAPGADFENIMPARAQSSG